MRALCMLLLLASPCLAQPADCPVSPTPGPLLPLQLDLAGRPGVPRGVTGQAFVAVPLSPQGNACDDDAPPPPRDVLRGAPSDDLLRGP